MFAKAIILIYTISNSYPNFGNLVVGMLIFKQFKTILRSVFHFLLELQFVFKGIVSKMLTEIAKGQLLDTRGILPPCNIKSLNLTPFPVLGSRLPLKWLFISK